MYLKAMITIFVYNCYCVVRGSVGSAERDTSCLFSILRLLIVKLTVSIITIISVDEMLNDFTILEGFGSESVLSIIYLNCLKLILNLIFFQKPSCFQVLHPVLLLLNK